MGQNREPRQKATPVWLINILQRRQDCTNVKIVYSINGVEKIGQLHTKKYETKLPP